MVYVAYGSYYTCAAVGPTQQHVVRSEAFTYALPYHDRTPGRDSEFKPREAEVP